ncbi:MAG: hypothetical protein RL266_1395 [Bacteroidota bacterium]|jgi:antitoxin component YwqK of YwqJK toxin-antitoxin module
MHRFLPIIVIVALAACKEPATESTSDGHTIKRGFFENGDLQAEVIYNKEGKKDGLTRSFYENGRVRAEYNYVNGSKEGMTRNYYKEGGVSSEINYTNNEKHGEYIKYYKEGGKYTVSTYVNGIQDGERSVYNRSGTLKSTMYYSGGRPLPGAKRFKPNGEERNEMQMRFTLDDKTALTGKAKLYVELDEKLPEVKFVYGVVDEQGKFKDGFQYPLNMDSNGRGFIEYTKSAYSMVMDKVEVVAIAQDRDQQVYLISGRYNLVLD